MQIYMFRSDTKRELRAFAGDLAGSRLPEKFAPWHATGVIKPDRAPPHKLPRDEIERAINDQGFQLWRMKPGT
jgi:hypothetical protein